MWTGALLIVKNYILSLIWGNDSTHLLDLHSKDESGNVSSSGIALLKFDTLHSLELYKKSLLQCLPIAFVLSNTMPMHCQCQESH